MAFQWLLTSSTDKFSSFRLSIVRFRCLLRKNYQLTIRTYSIFHVSSQARVHGERLQRRIYIIDIEYDAKISNRHKLENKIFTIFTIFTIFIFKII